MRTAGGIILAASILLGAVLGIVFGEPSAGFLIGLAAGIAGAILFQLFSGADGRPK